MAISQKVTARLRRTRLGPWLRGIDEKTAPYALPKDKVPAAQNLLLDESGATAKKRNGSRVLTLLPSGNPGRDGFVFSTAAGLSFLLASDGEDLYFTADVTLQSAWTLLKTGLDTEGFLEFETAEDKVWLTNGVDFVLSWDGVTLKEYDREFQSTTDAIAITTTTLRHAGLTGADDFWNGQSIVFIAGTNIGFRSTITDYDSATNELTFAPALPNAPAVTDRFKVGLIIPKGRDVRFWDGHLWMASTTDNPSELRFHRLTDPNTGADIDIDDPLAWPPTFQLDINSADGDRVWGMSPVLRDRILVFKSTGIFRIERDPLTTYTFEVVERAIGSRFQRSFAEKNQLLYFMGQDKDGLPDVYLTDMVDVRPVDPVGGIEPTLRALRQPNTVERLITFSSTAEFESGVKSSQLDTKEGSLSIDPLDTLAKWVALFQAGINVDIETNPGKVSVLGYPEWDDEQDCTALITGAGWVDASENPGGNFGIAIDLAGSENEFIINEDIPGGTDAAIRAQKSLSTGADEKVQLVRLAVRWTAYSFGTGTQLVGECLVENGDKGLTVQWARDKLLVNGSTVFTGGFEHFLTKRHIVIMLKSDGTFKVWLDDSQKASGNAEVRPSLRVVIGMRVQGISSAPDGNTMRLDYINFHEDFKGDDLDSQGGALINTALPTTLPTTGDITLQHDWTRAPSALKKIHQVEFAPSGSTFLAESFTSDSVDFTTGNDGAGFVAYSSGAVPGSAVKRFQRLKFTFTTDTTEGLGPRAEFIKNGVLWLSPAFLIGENITAWRDFLETLVKPGSTAIIAQIRAATVLTPPTEGDFGAFSTIVNGDNIGTILADGSPPSTRFVQIKFELETDAAGLLPLVEAFNIQWTEGSSDIIPLHAIVHKKRWLAAAALSPSNTNNIIVVNDRNNAWMKFVGLNVNFMVHFRGIFVGFSSIDDKILDIDAPAFNDQGVAIDAFIQTREEFLADESLRKDFRYGVLHLGDVTGTITASLKRVSDTAFTQAKTITLSGKSLDKRINFPPRTLTKRIQREYRNAVVDEDMDFRGETLYYALRSQLPNGG